MLIVDEVDDTRTTLQYCVEEVFRRSNPSHVAVAVVHNKQKEKKGTLPDDVQYFVGAHVADYWNCYPWDAGASDGLDIYEHEQLARECTVYSTTTKSNQQLDDTKAREKDVVHVVDKRAPNVVNKLAYRPS